MNFKGENKVDQKKNLPIRIVNIALIAVAIILYIYLFIDIRYAPVTTFLSLLANILNIMALASGLIYIAKGYKKNAAADYKIFMWLLVAAEVVDNTYIITLGGYSVINTVLALLTVVLFTLLAGANDYGKKNTSFIIVALLAVRVINFILLFTLETNLGNLQTPVVIDNIGQIILADTAGFMVLGKYADKEERGTK